jgi:hypothetical protein
MQGLELHWPGKQPPDPVAARLAVEEVGGVSESTGVVDHGDNLAVLAAWLEAYAGQVALVYLDPPFASGQPRRGDGDTVYEDPGLADPAAVLQPLYERLWLIRDLLADDGSLLLHCDHRLSPAMAMICDELFGRGDRGAGGRAPGFRNEIIWHYGLGGSSRVSYPKKHDSILWYSQGSRWTFHPPKVPATSQRLRGQLKHQPDVWILPSLNNQALERTGYPTQKPLALLERLLAAHTNPGDLVADPYAGAGTTAIAARRLGRRWLACDRSPQAIETIRQRLLADPHDPGWQLRRGDAMRPPTDSRIAFEVAPAALRLVGLEIAGARPSLDQVANWSIGAGEPFRAVWNASRSRGDGCLETTADLAGAPSAPSRVRVAKRSGEVVWHGLVRDDKRSPTGC